MKRRLIIPLATIALLTVVIVSSKGCASTVPNRTPVGERFPTATGTALDDTRVTVPDAFLGKPMLYLVAYDQDAQFDVDRWILGLLQSETTLQLRELPTIPGFIPRALSGTIDSGMRRGIPSPDWGAVITIYRDADAITKFLGNERSTNAYAVLVDATGTVRKVHSEGYSARVLLEFLETYATLGSSSPTESAPR